MKALKQLAITKHPNGTASFYLRVKTADGSMWEACTEEAKPIAEIITSLETEYLGCGCWMGRSHQKPGEKSMTEQTDDITTYESTWFSRLICRLFGHQWCSGHGGGYQCCARGDATRRMR